MKSRKRSSMSSRLRKKLSAPRKKSRVSRLPATLRSSSTEIKSCDVPQFNQKLENNVLNPKLLNGIIEGAAFYQRVGRKIEMKSLQIKGWMAPDENTTQDITQRGRILIVYDRQANGVAATWDDVIQSYSNTGAVSNGSLDFVNLDNRDRFVILRDIEMIMPSVTRIGTVDVFMQGTASHGNSAGEEFMINEYIPLKGLVTQFKGATGGIGDISTGSLLFFTHGTSGPNESGWFTQVACRLRYRDT